MMDREQFEQLVSRWLDQPHDEELRARVEAAAAQSNECARAREEWVRLARLIRQSSPPAQGVDWEALRRRIVQQATGTETPTAGEGLDDLLRTHTALEQRVDWRRYRRRLAQAAPAAAERPALVRFPRARVAAGIGLVAAAAAVVLVLVVPARQPRPGASFAEARVIPVAGSAGGAAPLGGFVRVSVHPPLDAQQVPQPAPPAAEGGSRARFGEVFLVIAPAAPSEAAAPFGAFGS